MFVVGFVFGKGVVLFGIIVVGFCLRFVVLRLDNKWLVVFVNMDCFFERYIWNGVLLLLLGVIWGWYKDYIWRFCMICLL